MTSNNVSLESPIVSLAAQDQADRRCWYLDKSMEATVVDGDSVWMPVIAVESGGYLRADRPIRGPWQFAKDEVAAVNAHLGIDADTAQVIVTRSMFPTAR